MNNKANKPEPGSAEFWLGDIWNAGLTIAEFPLYGGWPDIIKQSAQTYNPLKTCKTNDNILIQ